MDIRGGDTILCLWNLPSWEQSAQSQFPLLCFFVVMDQLCALCFCKADNQDDHRRESAASKAPDCSNCEILAKVRREIQAKNINVTEHKVAQIWNLQHTKALLFLLTSHVTLHMSLNLNVSTKLNTSLKYVLICQAVWSSRSIMGIIMIMTIIRRRKKCAYMPVWSSR